MLMSGVKNLNKNIKKIIKIGSQILFTIYLVILIYFLFFSEHYGRTIVSTEYKYNLQPFKEIHRFIKYRREIGFEGVVVNLLGNVLAFAPFGMVMPIISPRNRKFINILLLSFQLSLTIEIVQFFLRVGTFDVDDLLLNTVGGILGYIGFIIMNKIWLAYRKKII